MKEDIIKLVKAIKKNSGYDMPNREIAAKLGITEKRMSTLTNNGDMKLSTFIKILEAANMQMEISPGVEDGVSIRFCARNKCNECAYKHIAEQIEDAEVKMDEKTNRLVIEV